MSSARSLPSTASTDIHDHFTITPPIARWTKVSLLGRGAFGAVYKCLNDQTGGWFAMKEVNLHVGNTRQSKETKALAREIAVLRELRHENIVGYLGTDRSSENDLCVLMEFVAGGDCHSLLKKLGHGFPLPVIKRYTRDVCRGAVYLHSKDIAHRDIKGENVLVSVSGVCKLADFGVAAHLDQISGSVRGTPYYLSPEMIRGEASTERTVKSSDVWSIGCTVFEFATADPPWKQELQRTAPFYYVVGQVKPGDSLPLAIPDAVSPEVATFIRCAMVPDPQRRPSADDLLRDPFLMTEEEFDSVQTPVSVARGSSPRCSSPQILSELVHNGPCVIASDTNSYEPGKFGTAKEPYKKSFAENHNRNENSHTVTSPAIHSSELRFKCVFEKTDETKVFSIAEPVAYDDLCARINDAFGSVYITLHGANESIAVDSQDRLNSAIEQYHQNPDRKAAIKLHIYRIGPKTNSRTAMTLVDKAVDESNMSLSTVV